MFNNHKTAFIRAAGVAAVIIALTILISLTPLNFVHALVVALVIVALAASCFAVFVFRQRHNAERTHHKAPANPPKPPSQPLTEQQGQQTPPMENAYYSRSATEESHADSATTATTSSQDAPTLTIDDTQEIPTRSVQTNQLVPPGMKTGTIQPGRAPKWIPYAVAGGVTSILVVVALAVIVRIPLAGFKTTLITCGLIVVAGFYNFLMIRSEDKEKVAKEPFKYWANPKYVRLSERTMRDLVHLFEHDKDDPGHRDTVIYVATRKDAVVPFIDALAPAKIGIEQVANKKSKIVYSRHWRYFYGTIILIGLFVALHVWHPYTSTFTWVALVIAGLALVTFGLRTMFGYIQWVSWFLVVTDKRVMAIQQWPSILWWKDEDLTDLTYAQIQSCTWKDQDNIVKKGLRLVNFIGKHVWGILNVDGITKYDVDLNLMTSIPENRAISELIQGNLPENRQIV